MAAESERPPVGMMAPPPAEAAIPPEPPEVMARNLSTGSRLLSGGITFFFLSFLFAYFYLRAVNMEHLWRPHHVKPDQGLGAAFAACVALSAVLVLLAGRRMAASSRAWLGAATASLVLGLAAIVLQCIEYTVQPFGPTDGAYASVFCAWTAFYLLAMLGAMYWLETQVATESRARRRPAGAAGAAPEEGDIREADRLIAPGLDATVFFWTYLAALGLVMYVVLYLV